MRRLLVAASAALLTVALVACEPTPEELDARRSELKQELNARRVDHSRAALWTDAYAKAKADDVAKWDAATHTLSHSNPGEGYPPGYICWAAEILGVGNRTSDVEGDARAIVQAWEASPSHKELMLSAIPTHGGFGVAVGDDGKVYYAVELIDPC